MLSLDMSMSRVRLYPMLPCLSGANGLSNSPIGASLTYALYVDIPMNVFGGSAAVLLVFRFIYLRIQSLNLRWMDCVSGLRTGVVHELRWVIVKDVLNHP